MEGNSDLYVFVPDGPVPGCQNTGFLDKLPVERIIISA